MLDVLARYSLTTLSLWTVIFGMLIAGLVIGGYLIGRRERAATARPRGDFQLVESHHRVNGPTRYRHRPVKAAHPTCPPERPAPAARRVPTQRQAPRSEVLGRHAVEVVPTQVGVPAVKAGRHHRRETAK